MATLTYVDAMGEALDRLRGVGYEHGGKLVNHAPMAAEALATMGYADVVPTWVDHNLKIRRYHERPQPRWALSAADEADWRPALGDFARVADWSAMFERELTERPWTDVLQTWWPRLLPGMSGVMTHGVIRTAHAVRSMARADGDNGPQRAELAQGLGYWAARYSVHVPPAESDQDGDGAMAAFDELVAVSSGHYVRTPQGHPVPLIHAITGPAAVRLVCQYLPTDQHWPSYRAARANSEWMRSYYGSSSVPDGSDADEIAPLDATAEAALIADAVELGDEHAIKLAEVAVRHNALAPDHRYAVASHAATRQLRAFGGYYYD
jgi:hypothetical protein